MLIARRTDREKWWWLALGLAFLVLLYFLSPILTPFLLAGILAYIFNPMLAWFERHRVNRTIGAALAMLLLVGLVVLFAVIVVPLFSKEIKLLSDRLPGFLEQINTRAAPWIRERLGVQVQLDPASVREYIAETAKSTEGLGVQVLQSLKIGGLSLIGFLIDLLLIPVVLFYLLRDWNAVFQRIGELVPPRWRPKAREFFSEIDAVLAEFFRGQLSVMLVMAIYYSAALWLTGLEFFLPVGVVTGLLVFIPYVGSFLGLLLATLAGLMQFGPTMGLVWVWIAFGIGHGLEGMVVTPNLVGNRIGLHPIAVIFALLAFGQLFGFFGVLVALPASAALLVGLRHVRSYYLTSPLYAKEED